MAFVAGNKSRLAVGPLAASCYLKGVSWGGTIADLNTTVLCDTAVTRAAGLADASVSMNGLWDNDATATGMNSLLSGFISSPPDTATPVSFAPYGFAAGSRVIAAPLRAMSYDRSTTVDGLVEFSFSFGLDGGADLNGESLYDLSAVTVDTLSAAVDSGAASSNGGAAYLHVTAFSGLTSAAITVQHATASNGTYNDIATFTSVTAATSERVVVSAGTTVRRYLKLNIDVTGTGSLTLTASFARR